MRKTVLLDLEHLKDLNCGLGQVSYQLAKRLDGYDDGEIKIHFLVPNTFRSVFKSETEPVSWQRRHFPFCCKKYDLWHAIHQHSSYFPSRLHRTPYLLTIHDLNFLGEKRPPKARRRLKRLQRKVSRASAITVISKFTEDVVRKHLHLRGLWNREIPVFTIYQGVDLPVYSMGQPPFPISGKFFFAIGSVEKKKNFIALVDFMKQMPNDQLVIAGNKNTAYAKEVQDRIQTLGLANRVFLPGIIGEEEKAWLYQHCEAFLFPSKYEGFGMPVIEAMGFGKPVFLSTWSSLPEIGGHYAYYWKDFDPERMREVFLTKMAEYKSNPTFPEKLKEYAKSYNWDKTVAEYIKVYRHLLGLTVPNPANSSGEIILRNTKK